MAFTVKHTLLDPQQGTSQVLDALLTHCRFADGRLSMSGSTADASRPLRRSLARARRRPVLQAARAGTKLATAEATDASAERIAASRCSGP